MQNSNDLLVLACTLIESSEEKIQFQSATKYVYQEIQDNGYFYAHTDLLCPAVPVVPGSRVLQYQVDLGVHLPPGVLRDPPYQYPVCPGLQAYPGLP